MKVFASIVWRRGWILGRLAAPDPKYLKLTLVCLRKCNAPMQESEVIPVPRRLPMISAVKFIPERSSPGREGAQLTYPSLSFSSVKFCGKVFTLFRDICILFE